MLSNVLLEVKGQQLTMTGTDLEVELVARHYLDEVSQEGAVTVPGKNSWIFAVLCPDGSDITIEQDEQRRRACRALTFTLSTSS